MAIQIKQNHSKVNEWQARGPRYWCTPAFQYQCLCHQFWLFDAVSTLVVTLQFLDHWHYLCLVWVHESPRTFGGTGPGFSDTNAFCDACDARFNIETVARHCHQMCFHVPSCEPGSLGDEWLETCCQSLSFPFLLSFWPCLRFRMAKWSSVYSEKNKRTHIQSHTSI